MTFNNEKNDFSLSDEGEKDKPGQLQKPLSSYELAFNDEELKSSDAQSPAQREFGGEIYEIMDPEQDQSTTPSGSSPSIDIADIEAIPKHTPWDGGSRKRALPALLLVLIVALTSFWRGEGKMTEVEYKYLGIIQQTLEWRHTDAGPRGIGFDQMDLISDAKRNFHEAPLYFWLVQGAWRVIDGKPLVHTATASENVMRPKPESELAHAIVKAAAIINMLSALLLISSIFWLGHTLIGTWHGLVAAMTIVSLPGMILLSQLLVPYSLALSLTAFALAASVWAIRPYRPLPGTARQFTGWLIGGVALGCSILAGGLSALISVCLPLIILVMLAPSRKGHLLGQIAAFSIAFLICVPWLVHAHEHDDQAWRMWLGLKETLLTGREMLAQVEWHMASTDRLMTHILISILWVLPWSLWCALALVFEITPAASSVRQRHFVTVSWFILLLIGGGWLFISGLWLMLIVPFSLLISTFTMSVHELNKQKRYAVNWHILRWGQSLIMISLNVVFILILTIPHRMNQIAGFLASQSSSKVNEMEVSTPLFDEIVIRLSRLMQGVIDQVSQYLSGWWLLHLVMNVILISAMIWVAKIKHVLGIFLISACWWLYASRLLKLILAA